MSPLAWLLALACSGAGNGESGASAPTDTAGTCEPAALPANTDTVATAASVYDPGAGCWRSTTVELDAALWQAYGDTGAACDDIELLFARVDCSCVLIGSQCGDVGAAVRADPAVAYTEEAYDRCVRLRETAPDCG
jgi:hypothetical protein